MHSQTNEEALEAAIEKALTGASQEYSHGVVPVLDPLIPNVESDTEHTTDSDPTYRSGKGYYIGFPNDFNARYAIDEKRFWHFLEATQKEELEKIQRSSDWKLK